MSLHRTCGLQTRAGRLFARGGKRSPLPSPVRTPRSKQKRSHLLAPVRLNPPFRRGGLIAPLPPARPIERGEVAAVIAGDRHVQREREALGNYLVGAYRDPHEARSRLAELVKTHGHTSAAQRLVADPGQLGELQGKVGLLAGAAGRQERTRAERVAEAIGPAVARIGAAEVSAGATYTAQVQAQWAAEATGVPRLSEKAQVALAGIKAAKDTEGQAEAWTALQGDAGLAFEVKQFMGAVEQRFGTEGVRALDRSGTLESAKVGPGERAALGKVGGAVQAAREGARAAESLGQKLGLGMRLKP